MVQSTANIDSVTLRNPALPGGELRIPGDIYRALVDAKLLATYDHQWLNVLTPSDARFANAGWTYDASTNSWSMEHKIYSEPAQPPKPREYTTRASFDKDDDSEFEVQCPDCSAWRKPSEFQQGEAVSCGDGCCTEEYRICPACDKLHGQHDGEVFQIRYLDEKDRWEPRPVVEDAYGD